MTGSGPRYIEYPDSPASDDAFEMHGIRIPAPYTWLEDVEAESVRSWVAAQNSLTGKQIPKDDVWRQLKDSFSAMPEFVPEALPIECGSRSFRFDQHEAASQPGLLMTESGAEHTVLMPGHSGLDSRMRIAREFVYPSANGRFVAFAGSLEATDMQSVFVWDVNQECLLDETIAPTANPVVAWLPDETGFYYNVCREVLGGEPWQSQKDGLYFHELGTPPSQDRLIFEYANGPGHTALPWLSSDGKYLFIKTLDFVTQLSGLLYLRPQLGQEPIWLFQDQEARVNLIGLRADQVYLETSWGAPNSRVLRVNLLDPDRQNWTEVVPEKRNPIARTTHSVVSQQCCLCGDILYVTYLVHACNRIECFAVNGDSQGAVEIQEFSSVLQLRPAAEGSGLELALTSFLLPFSHWRLASPGAPLQELSRVSAGCNPDHFVLRQEFCRSPDGTEVPMFIILPKNPAAGRPPPVLLYGYGGWGQALAPEFRPDLIAWINQGGCYVVANIRGGSEYGEAWHDAGRLLNKTNCFDDFCAVAEYLLSSGTASRGKLAIRGLSNGGLLTAACANRRPELFDAAITEVPLVDVVRLMDTPIGGPVSMELGNPEEDEEVFRYMMSYSPLQNIEACEQRPDVMVVVAEEDERALPHFAYQYTAAMQATTSADQIVLLRTIAEEGHSIWPWDVTVESLCEQLRFLLGATTD